MVIDQSACLSFISLMTFNLPGLVVTSTGNKYLLSRIGFSFILCLVHLGGEKQRLTSTGA